MSTLLLTDFQYVIKTSKAGHENPYFVFFLGRPEEPMDARLVRIRKPYWDNDHSQSDRYLHQAAISDVVDAGTLVLCALLEEDGNADMVTGNGALKKICGYMKTSFSAWGRTGENFATIAATLIPTFAKQLDSHTTNDALVNVVLLPTDVNLREHGSFTFKSESAHYDVWFDLV